MNPTKPTKIVIIAFPWGLLHSLCPSTTMFYILMVLFKLKFYISSFDYNCGMETVSKLTQARLLSPGYCMYTSELTRIHTQQSDANSFKVQG